MSQGLQRARNAADATKGTPRRKWRVYGGPEDPADFPSENKAYELVRAVIADGGTATVYVWDVDRWALYEVMGPEG